MDIGHFLLPFFLGFVVGMLLVSLLTRWLRGIVIGLMPGGTRKKPNIPFMVLTTIGNPSLWVLGLVIWLGLTHRFGDHPAATWIWFFAGLLAYAAMVTAIAVFALRRARALRADKSSSAHR